jgi:hypothetical protein
LSAQREQSLSSDDDDEAVAVPEGFRIDDEGKASWVARKIREARNHAEHVERWAALETRRAQRREQWLLHRFAAELEAWTREELQRRGERARSVALPGGTLALRRVPPALGIVNESELLVWCHGHLVDAVRITVEADGPGALELLQWRSTQEEPVTLREGVLRKPVREHFQETGEVPPGTVLRPAEDQFSVK